MSAAERAHELQAVFIAKIQHVVRSAPLPPDPMRSRNVMLRSRARCARAVRDRTRASCLLAGCGAEEKCPKLTNLFLPCATQRDASFGRPLRLQTTTTDLTGVAAPSYHLVARLRKVATGLLSVLWQAAAMLICGHRS